MRADRFCRTTTTSIIRVSSILLLLKNKNPTTNLFRQSNSTTPYYILLLVPNVDFRGPRCVLLRGGPILDALTREGDATDTPTAL